MSVLSNIIAFLGALPEILRLIRVLQARIDQDGVNRKVAQDVKTIHEAFNANDASKLNALFKS